MEFSQSKYSAKEKTHLGHQSRPNKKNETKKKKKTPSQPANATPNDPPSPPQLAHHTRDLIDPPIYESKFFKKSVPWK